MYENLSSNTPEEKFLERPYKKPKCNRNIDDPAFVGKQDFEECSKILNKNGDMCHAPIYCHLSVKTPLSYEKIESNEDKYLINGLCIECLSIKLCCRINAHSSAEDLTQLKRKINDLEESIQKKIKSDKSDYEEVFIEFDLKEENFFSLTFHPTLLLDIASRYSEIEIAKNPADQKPLRLYKSAVYPFLFAALSGDKVVEITGRQIIFSIFSLAFITHFRKQFIILSQLYGEYIHTSGEVKRRN